MEEEAISLKTVAVEPNDCPLVPRETPVLRDRGYMRVHWPVLRLRSTRGHITMTLTCDPVWFLSKNFRDNCLLLRPDAGRGSQDHHDLQIQQSRGQGSMGSQVHGRYGLQAKAHWSLPIASSFSLQCCMPTIRCRERGWTD